MSGLYITGTDTGVGKTLVCALLARYLHLAGERVITQKWVQTGCVGEADDLRVHCRIGGLPEDPAWLAARNPYCFALPASPHLAAEAEGRPIDPEVIIRAYQALASSFDPVLVEGAGGALAPLTRSMLAIDLVARLGMPALLVVGNKLGCINHALLTVEALRARDIPVLGLVFNSLPGCSDDARIIQDNPRITAQLSGVPLLGELPVIARPHHGSNAVAAITEALMRVWKREHHD